MTFKEIQKEIAMVHNAIAEIPVSGENAFRAVDAMSRCRRLVQQIADMQVEEAPTIDEPNREDNEVADA